MVKFYKCCKITVYSSVFISLLRASVEDDGDGLGALDLPELELDVLQEVVVAGVEPNLGTGDISRLCSL